MNNKKHSIPSIAFLIFPWSASGPIYLITPMPTFNNYFRTRTAYNFLKDFYNTFDSYENVKIVPIEIAVDTLNDFGENDLIHPLNSGYKKIADAVYSVLCANQ